jgi:hypothetical protein
MESVEVFVEEDMLESNENENSSNVSLASIMHGKLVWKKNQWSIMKSKSKRRSKPSIERYIPHMRNNGNSQSALR